MGLSSCLATSKTVNKDAVCVLYFGCEKDLFALATKVFSFFFLLIYAQAQAVTLTVAQAFKVALDLWEIAQEGESVVIILERTEGNLHARTGL